MGDERELLRRTAEIAADFVESLDERSIRPRATVDELRAALGGPLPEAPSDPLDVIEALAAAAEPGVVGIPSGRYFGFVIGGSLPAALAADWLTSVWDQNAGLVIGGPSAAVTEQVAGEWLKDLLGLPETASFAFVTGCQMAHVTCLAAARHEVLRQIGWDVEANGLAGSPPITLVTGGRKHVTVDRALRLLGLGSESTRQTVKRRKLVAFAEHIQGAVLLLQPDARRNRNVQFAFGSFYTQFLTDHDLHASGNGNGLFANT